MFNQLSAKQIIQKLEQYCAYQERCHKEVHDKLRSLTNDVDEIDAVVVHLITNNYLNEERFARAFARGKHRIKAWGTKRIILELKQRQISAGIIKLALTEIDDDDYQNSFIEIAERKWESLNEPNTLKKRKKFCDFLLRKGYDSAQVFEIAMKLERIK